MTNDLRDQLQQSQDWWDRAVQIVRKHNRLSTEVSEFCDGDFTANRKKLQLALIKSIVKNVSVPCDGKALFVGGMPGAGKSTMLPAVVEPSEYFILDPDDIKVEMIKADMCPTVPGLTPLECGPLIHYESCQITKKIATRLIKKRTNIVYPMTFSAMDAVETRVQWCKNSDYDSIDGLYVTVRLETSTRRVKVRHREGLEEFLVGVGFGGRFIDIDKIDRYAGTNRFESAARAWFGKSRIIDNEFDLI